MNEDRAKLFARISCAKRITHKNREENAARKIVRRQKCDIAVVEFLSKIETDAGSMHARACTLGNEAKRGNMLDAKQRNLASVRNLHTALEPAVRKRRQLRSHLREKIEVNFGNREAFVVCQRCEHAAPRIDDHRMPICVHAWRRLAALVGC